MNRNSLPSEYQELILTATRVTLSQTIPDFRVYATDGNIIIHPAIESWVELSKEETSLILDAIITGVKENSEGVKTYGYHHFLHARKNKQRLDLSFNFSYQWLVASTNPKDPRPRQFSMSPRAETLFESYFPEFNLTREIAAEIQNISNCGWTCRQPLSVCFDQLEFCKQRINLQSDLKIRHGLQSRLESVQTVLREHERKRSGQMTNL